MALLKTGATHYYSQLGLLDNSCAIKGWSCFKSVTLDVLNSISLGRDGTVNYTGNPKFYKHALSLGGIKLWVLGSWFKLAVTNFSTNNFDLQKV